MLCCAIGSIIAVIITAIWGLLSRVRTYHGGMLGAGPRPYYQQLQLDAARKYSKYKKKPKKIPFVDFCYPKSFRIQPQQAFAGEYMKPGSGHKELLVFHKIGAGKTCLEIQILERWKGAKGMPCAVMPASLIPNFRNELRSPCAGEWYITEEERADLKMLEPDDAKYKEIIRNSDKRIDKVYQIYSYNKFAEEHAHITAPIIIIDEVQNVDNEFGVFYKSLLKWIRKHPKAAVVVMSGTPIFDKPKELVSIAELMHIEPPVVDGVKTLLPRDILSLFAGKVSYYAGAPAYTFPEAQVKILKCPMSSFQAKWYKSQVEIEMSKQGKLLSKEITNDFYIKSRQRSNIVYPNGLTGISGLTALTKATIMNNLGTYSCKFNMLIRKLLRGKLSFVYTSFTGPGGISAIKKILAAHGYLNFAVHGPGKRRYAIFSGEETLREKDAIRAVFNSPANDDASRLQIVIGSPAIKEGISLMRVKQVHVLELYWNHSRLEQIFGRAVRYCSHKSLPRAERVVSIYLYAAVDRRSKIKTDPNHKYTPLASIDLYMLEIADKKKDEAEPYVEALMECAVDKLIHGY